MNILDRLLGHDHDTTYQLLLLCRGLTDEELDRPLDAGVGAIRRTFEHMISNIESWTDLMMGRPVRTPPGRSPVADLMSRLQAGYAEFAVFARQVEKEGRLDDLWLDHLDEPPVQKTYGGAIAHVITHNMHHRAELLHMMQRLGMQDLPEGDLMGWDQRHRLGR